MTGRELYDIYRGYLEMLGGEADDWSALEVEQQKAWSAAASWAEDQRDG